MKFFKKTVSAALAVVMALCSNVVCSADDNVLYAEANEKSSIHLSAEDVVCGDTFTENDFELNTVLNYSPEIQSRTVYNAGSYIYHKDTLTSDNAVNFYVFTLSGERTAVLTLQTTGDYIALICPYDPSTGNVDVSSNNPYVTKGQSKYFSMVNQDNKQKNFCLVVMNLGSEYGASYTVGMNATNPSNAISMEYVNANLSKVVCVCEVYGTNKKRDMVFSNGKNITLAAAEYILEMEGTVFQDEYKSGGASNITAEVGVVSGGEYIEGDTLYYGTYTSTNPYTNIQNGLGHSSNEVILIPINGYVYTCAIMGNYINYQFLRDVATGFLVYDLNTEKVIDWMSTCNLFYADPGYFNFTFSYTIYAELPFKSE